MSISGLESVKKGDFVKIGQDRAWVYALFKDHVLAAVLSDRSVNYEGHAEIDPDFQLQVPTDRIHEGQSLTAFMPNAKGQSFQSFLHSKAPYHHLKSIKQLLTGYHQVDVCQPISLGQTVLFYGKANQGQSKLTNETAEKFLKSPQHKVVICSCSPSKKKKVFENSIHYTTDVLSSDVSQCFTPYIALAHAAYLRDQGHHVLFILEDLLHHAYKERSLFHAFKIVLSI